MSSAQFADWIPAQRTGRSSRHRSGHVHVDAWRSVPVEVRAPSGAFVLDVNRWTDAAAVAAVLAQERGLAEKHVSRLVSAIQSVQRDLL